SDMDVFYRAWQQHPRAVAIFHHQDPIFQQAQRDLPMRVIYQDPMRIAVVRP
ncbi:MAG: hypothetical protein HQL66_02745, partial [Magnetococcales bacterium]|nr:hypothetical protein [Magnetococcales bacterium]